MESVVRGDDDESGSVVLSRTFPHTTTGGRVGVARSNNNNNRHFLLASPLALSSPTIRSDLSLSLFLDFQLVSYVAYALTSPLFSLSHKK